MHWRWHCVAGGARLDAAARVGEQRARLGAARHRVVPRVRRHRPAPRLLHAAAHPQEAARTPALTFSVPSRTLRIQAV